jgi:hypothetical protein
MNSDTFTNNGDVYDELLGIFSLGLTPTWNYVFDSVKVDSTYLNLKVIILIYIKCFRL